MRRFALIGKDIHGSLSPAIHSYCFNALSLDAVYDIIDIDSESRIPDVISKLRAGSLDGVNVTAPYKKDFMPYLDQLNPRAESIGSVNCIHSNNGKLIGNNTDWFGFGQSLRDFNNFDNVIILGGGGVVPAVLYYFETRNNFSIHIIGRNLKKIECFKNNNISIYDFNNFDLDVENSIIINTIPSTAKIDWSSVMHNINSQPRFAMDLNYHLKATEFLNYFDSSVKVKNGLDMLIHQALMSVDIWYERDVTSSIDICKLKEYLTR